MSSSSQELRSVEGGFGSQMQFAKSTTSLEKTKRLPRTSCEIGLAVILVLAVGICIVLVVLLVDSELSKDAKHAGSQGGTDDKTTKPTASNNRSGTCLTADCVTSAAMIIDAMDQMVEPCEDFYEYACGSWNKKNIIPDNKASVSKFGKLNEEVEVKLKELLDVPISEKDTNATSKTKTLFRSCVNEALIKARDVNPLRDFIATIGGWPMIDYNWTDANFDVMNLITDLRKYGNLIFISALVGNDDRNSSVNIIQFDQPGLGMPGRDYYLKGRDDGKLMAYQHFARDVAVALGANAEKASKDAEEIVDLEIYLANITIPAEERRDYEALYNRMTVADMYTNITDKIDWQRYLHNLFLPLNMSIADSEEVVVYSPVYLRKVADIIENTSNRTLANYLVWRIVMNRLNTLSKSYRDLRNTYYEAIYGTVTPAARWRDCVSYVKANGGLAVGRMFVENHFDETAKADTLDMIKNLRKSFSNLLGTVPWLDVETRRVAEEKAEAIEEKIGFPNYIMNDTYLDEIYSQLQFNEDKYFENDLEVLFESYQVDFKKLRSPIDKTLWSVNPAVVNAYYDPNKNMIMFPAGFLQPPFYGQSRLKALNYGAIGYVIGHEITHGFDDMGRQYNKDGNLVQWWSDKVVTDFKDKAQCIIDQYSNYTVKEINMKINGINTQGENIADNGGIKQSFKAYRQWVADQGHEEQRLPGMEHFTPNQLFFLSFAQILCGSSRPQSYLSQIRTGVHSPISFRVKGVVSNSADFADAFKCPVGAPMNPVKKCSVWYGLYDRCGVNDPLNGSDSE